ncbi:MAG: acyl-CoA dehydratase activase-related protein [Oscillospiraceae bacterium]|nr:acyl-CoA dehydratase activase-related protein [Oscillospiraceae bacterium]
MKIGIPRGFLYFKYKYFWETFLKELDCEIVLSPMTNKAILKEGIDNSIDESCLSAKVYMGHVKWLVGKCDYILMPRIDSFGKCDKVCTKFNAMYDIVRNTYEGVELLDYNIDCVKGCTEFKAFMRMGKLLKKSKMQTYRAYKRAKEVNKEKKTKIAEEQEKLVQESDSLKILIVAHPYNIYDKLIGEPIVKYVEKLDVLPIYADVTSTKKTRIKYKELSSSLYWTYNKELIGAIEHYKNKVDGIMFVTAFPCGPDSMVNEICLRRIKNIPMINIVLDELQGEAGLHTRIESFIDIIREKKKVVKK